MKKTDCSRWLLSSHFGRMVYAGYSDLHGKWTAGFCDGYIRVSAGSYQELVDKLGMPVAATPSCQPGNVPPTHLGRTHRQTLGRTIWLEHRFGAPSAKVRDGDNTAKWIDRSLAPSLGIIDRNEVAET